MKIPIDFTKKQLLGCMNWAEFGNGERQGLDVVGWENRPRTFPGIPIKDTNWRIRMTACSVRAGELNGWIGRQFDEIARWTPVVSPELVGLLGTLHDESACLLEQIPAGEVGVCPIGQIKARAGQHLIENTDVVSGIGGRINIGRNAGWAMEQSEHSDHTVGADTRSSIPSHETAVAETNAKTGRYFGTLRGLRRNDSQSWNASACAGVPTICQSQISLTRFRKLRDMPS
jgi:hypothetical protein